jgi:hypothetical protein
MRSSPAARARFTSAAAALVAPGRATATETFAAAFAILHHRLPDAQLVYASTDAGRIGHFLAAVREADRIGCARIAQRFDDADAALP